MRTACVRKCIRQASKRVAEQQQQQQWQQGANVTNEGEIVKLRHTICLATA